MTATSRPFAFPVRLLHRETVGSYTRRVLEANHEFLDLPKRRRSSHGPDAVFSWVDVLAFKTGRAPSDFAVPEGGFIHHRDGSTCAQCWDLTPLRVLCTHCAAGSRVEQHAHHDAPICRKHKRWIGYGTDTAHQQPIGPHHIAAARALGRLRTAGRYEHRIFLLILHTLAPNPEAEPIMFPVAVQIMQAVTARDFLIRLLNPALSYAAARQVLVTAVTASTANPDVVRALWASLRSVFAHLHAQRHGRASVPAPWTHSFPVPADILRAAATPARPFEPLAGFLAAAKMSLRDSIKIETRHKLLEHDRADGHRLRTLCANGHQLVVLRGGSLVRACTICRPGVKPGVNDLHTKAPRLVAEWDVDANDGILPETVPAGSSVKYWWRCGSGHPFQATPSNRYANKTACPVCMNRLIIVGVNDLRSTHPEIARELGPRSNAAELTAHSEKEIPFTCAEGHTFWRRVVDRVAGKGCMECSRRVLTRAGESIADTHPHLVAEWHPKYNKFSPEHYSYGSKEDAWWICAKGHPFKQRIERRTRAGYSCGVCSKRQRVIGVNDLATTDPQLASEWHPYKNWTPPTDVTAIDKLFWWKCSTNGHEYQQTVDHRRKSKGCPQCPAELRILVAA